MSFQFSQLSAFPASFVDLDKMDRDLNEDYPSDSGNESDKEFNVAIDALEQVLVMGNEEVELREYGQSNRNWVSFTTDLSSKDAYLKRVTDFLQFHQQNGEVEMERSVEKYFENAHNAKNGDGSARFAPPTLASWFSILAKFWSLTGRTDLNKSAVIVLHNIKKWKKTYKKTQAAVFTKDNIRKFTFMQ